MGPWVCGCVGVRCGRGRSGCLVWSQVLGSLPAIAAFVGGDGCVWAQAAGRERSVVHLWQEEQRYLPMRVLLARAVG